MSNTTRTPAAAEFIALWEAEPMFAAIQIARDNVASARLAAASSTCGVSPYGLDQRATALDSAKARLDAALDAVINTGRQAEFAAWNRRIQALRKQP